MKVIITKGLPGSGKSTWAKSLVAIEPNKYKRVSKDDLREMLDCGHWSNDTEKFILKIRDAIILEAIAGGKHVIVDDTNLHPKHEARIRQLVREVEIKDFTHVPIDECIKNDLKRLKSVGEKVIRQMHDQFLATKEIYDPNESLPDAIIVDMDGTLAIMDGRSPFEWAKVGLDKPNKQVVEIVRRFANTHQIIIVSGRDEICRSETKKWLEACSVPYHHIFMRTAGSNEKDTTIKRDIFEKHIRNQFNIQYVLDDRNSVVEMWRSLGLICLQVAEGNF